MEPTDDTTDVLFRNLLLNVHDEPPPTPITFTPHNWLKTAKIYNQRLKQVPSDWVIEHSDVVVVLFSAKGADRYGVIEKFQETYEKAKYANLPIEVLNVPLDNTAYDAAESFENQANWFTLLFDDPLILVLKYMYGITCVPYIYVLRPTCEIVSNNGIEDLDVYGKNAIVSWMSATPVIGRKLTNEIKYYGGVWKYLGSEMQKHDNLADGDGNLVKTPDKTQEVTRGVSQDVTGDVTQDIHQVNNQNISRILSQTASKENSEEKLKDELKNLHYTC